MNEILQQIKHSFSREKPLFAVLKILRYGYFYLRSIPIRWVLKAPGLYIGPKFLLLGTKYIHIGKSFYAHSNLWIEAIAEYKNQRFEPKIIIGDRVKMGDAVHLSCNQRIQIGNDVLFGSNIFIGDHQHGDYNGSTPCNPYTPPALRSLSVNGTIVIGDNVWIGNNVSILGSVIIGSGSVIASNSVVIRNIPENTIVGGIPANAIKQYDPQSLMWIKPY